VDGEDDEFVDVHAPAVERLEDEVPGRDFLPDTRRTLMLVGPGRWGTSMPSLGVPVSFAEINTASVI
jgi:hypothetical protein